MWLTIPLTGISSIPQRQFCLSFHIINSHVWFIVICHSLQLLWNDSFPYKSFSHKLIHFHPVSPYALVCIFPNSTQLYFPCISSHRLSITNFPYARLAGNVFDKQYISCISQEVLCFKWQKSNPNSIKPKKDLICLCSEKVQGYSWRQMEQGLDTATICPPLLCFSACGFHSLLLPKGF